MCGLAGIFHPAAATGDVDAALLTRMTTALAHRGPDGDGFHIEPGLGLGHRRLAVIDPAGGHQPMYNEDHSVVIVFNGMIYNAAELRPELLALGHVFRSGHSDTETILHAWESWGTACLSRLAGMFAFALWDRGRRQLFVARDRLGKKPLYYARLPDGRLVFASEMCGLAAVACLPRVIDPAAVDDFFAYGYVPDPGTIYRGIHKLPAAHFLLLGAGTAAGVAPVRYWSPPTQTVAVSEQDAISQLRAGLDAAVQCRLVADVRLGAFLSGGVDSSAVVATAARLQTAKLATFTIGFNGAEDETPYAAMLAARYGAEQYTERAAKIDMIDAARAQGEIFGEPFGDPSAAPTHSVCALARRHATVALSGDGGDEVLAGYRRHRWHLLVESVRAHIPGTLRRQVIGRLARAYPKLDRAPRWLRARHTLTELGLDSARGYFATVARTQDRQRRALFSRALLEALDGHDPAARVVALMDQCGGDDALLQAQYVDLHTWLVGDILTKVDRTSMAHGLEVRAPLLDHRFVEWGLRLPAALKLRGAEGKYVLKRAMAPYVPREILYRPKQGFTTSLAGLFRAEGSRARARLLSGPMAECGLFDLDAIARLLDEHAQGGRDHSAVLWLLLVFEGFLAWHERAGGAQALAPAALADA